MDENQKEKRVEIWMNGLSCEMRDVGFVWYEMRVIR